mgnify:CR=1 FL=1
MNQSQNESLLNSLNDKNESLNINCMSTIKTYIEYSSSNVNINMKIFDLSQSDGVKNRIHSYLKKKTTLEEIQAIYFDKTIYSLLQKQKMSNKDYFYLFYVFFIKENYRSYVIQLGHKNFGKFFKKFFNSCVISKILNNYDIAGYIDFYLLNLYQLLTNSNEENISNLKEKKMINLSSLDSVDIKYFHLLVKYILGLANILEYTKEYKNYPKIIFDSFSSMEDIIFQRYFMKQINKIFLNKSIYVYGNNLVQQIFLYILKKENKKSLFDFKVFGSYILNSILHYESKYYKNNNKIKNNKNISNNNASPFYFLNLNIIISIMNDNLKDYNLMQKMLLKFENIINDKINLFVEDGNQLRIAENLLIDTLNYKLIKQNLDTLEIIKPYLNLDENNDKKVIFFNYLFYDICIDKYIIFYSNNLYAQNNEININTEQESSFSFSSQENNNSFNNNNITNSGRDIMKKIIKKFNNSDDYFINKYFNNIKNNDNCEEILSKLKIEELFILLDILYNISTKLPEEKTRNCVSDIHKIIYYIILKSSEEKTFNSCIYNFIISVDQKYTPPQSAFDIFKSVEILMKNSMEEFIISYPLYLIFIMNFFPKKNLEIKQFLNILQAFLIGYKTNVFNSIDENVNTKYSYTLQINYLSIVYIMISEILKIISMNKINDNNGIICTKEICKFLPYCLYCKRKIKKPLVLTDYLCQCTYCGKNMLYLNTNLNDYLNDVKNKKEIKEFVDNCVYDIITGITCNILSKFIEKYEKRNIYSIFCYPLYYKLMKEHFKYLNIIKIIIGKNIPFVFDKNSNINNKEGSIEDYLNNFFDKYISIKSKYPFKNIYDAINNDNFTSFNLYRKTIKHERELVFYKYDKK